MFWLFCSVNRFFFFFFFCIPIDLSLHKITFFKYCWNKKCDGPQVYIKLHLFKVLLESVLSDGCFWRIKLATSLLQLLYCHDPHRTVGILLCVFALAMTVNFLMLSTQPDFLRHGLAFPSPRRKTASSSLTDGQSVLPLLLLLTFGGSIHGSFYLNQPEALYATPRAMLHTSDFASCFFSFRLISFAYHNPIIWWHLLQLPVQHKSLVESPLSQGIWNGLLGWLHYIAGRAVLLLLTVPNTAQYTKFA